MLNSKLIFMLLLVASVCCASPVAVAAQTAEAANGWVKVAPEGEEFSVSMPKAPAVEEEQKSFAGWRVAGRRYRLKEDGTLYTVWSFKPEAIPPGVYKDREAYLDLCAELAWEMIVKPEYEAARTSRSALTAGYDYALLYRQAVPSPTYPGRTYLLSIGKRRGLTQIHAGAERIYLITALAEGSETSKPEAFIKSLTLGGKSLTDETEATVARVAGMEGGVGPGRGGTISRGGGAAPGANPVDYNKPFSGRDVTKRVSIRAKPEPSYTDAARKFGVTGSVRLRMVLLASGEVSAITPLTRLPHGLTQQAIEAASAIKFAPAIKDGRPVSQYVLIEYNFNIY